MCGLVAVFGDLHFTEEKFFCDLLQVDVLRGADSTGIGFIRPTGNHDVVKDVLLPTDLLQTKEVKTAFTRFNLGLIGHNRAATRGKVKAENAHPFICDHIIGAHNGTLNSQGGLVNAWKFGTDSEAMFDNIAHEGIEKTWAKVDGGTAMIWWDDQEETFNFIRNAGRPLSFAYTEDQRTLVVASEPWMIHGCASRWAGIKLDKVLTPKVNNHFIFKYDFKDGLFQTGGELTPMVKTTPVVIHVDRKQKEDEQRLPFEPEKKKKGNGDTSFSQNGYSDGSPTTMIPSTSTENDFTELDDLLETLCQKDIDEKTFHKKYKQCTGCSEALDYNTAIILDKFNAMCDDCASLVEQNNMVFQRGM